MVGLGETNSSNTELDRANKASRRRVLKIGSISILLLAGKSLTEARIPLPFLRGGYIALSSTKTVPAVAIKQRKRKNAPNPIVHNLSQLQNSLDSIGSKIQSETVKHWTGIHSHFENEWSKFASNVARLFPAKQKANLKKLDDVLSSFQSVLHGRQVRISQLLTACQAHLTLVKSGGAALKLVAKDMESNLQKVMALHNQLPQQNLSSMLQYERSSGIHEGNSLKDWSAAMGLLWIRRSLAFQLDLYSSLLPSSKKSPTQAAMDAYDKHLLPYHGWMLQKVFPMSLSQLPDKQVFIAKFGGIEVKDMNESTEREIVERLSELVKVWEPMLDVWRDDFERLDMEDVRRA